MELAMPTPAVSGGKVGRVDAWKRGQVREWRYGRRRRALTQGLGKAAVREVARLFSTVHWWCTATVSRTAPTRRRMWTVCLSVLRGAPPTNMTQESFIYCIQQKSRQNLVTQHDSCVTLTPQAGHSCLASGPHCWRHDHWILLLFNKKYHKSTKDTPLSSLFCEVTGVSHKRGVYESGTLWKCISTLNQSWSHCFLRQLTADNLRGIATRLLHHS